MSGPGRRLSIIARIKSLTDQIPGLRTFFPTYVGDGMQLTGKSLAWANDADFARAYAAGTATGHRYGDIRMDWRAHVVCWAASHAKRLAGDFVECGVNTGILSVAVCTYPDFNTLDKDFWLFDTFEGSPVEQMSPGEAAPRVRENARWYGSCYDLARRNFAPWPRAQLVRGRVPETLAGGPERVCYLSIDMNLVEPEIAAIEHFCRDSRPEHRSSSTIMDGRISPCSARPWTGSLDANG